MSYLSVSTWSLHRLLGPLRWTTWDAEERVHRTITDDQPQVFSLLDLPKEAASRGYQAVEICHFHFPSTDPSYLESLKQACADARISFDTLLLDYGDLTSFDEVRIAADIRLIREWIQTAALAGAKQIRVIAGEAPPGDEEGIEQAARHLMQLADYGASLGVRVVTENFRPLTSTGSSCLQLLESMDHEIAIITDFGNFEGASKYDDLKLTVPFSTSIHAKAHYDEQGYADEQEFLQCLDVLKESRYDGAIVLIYDGPGDMWEGLERIQRIIKQLG